jgi:hypothetical protein
MTVWVKRGMSTSSYETFRAQELVPQPAEGSIEQR